MLIDLSLLRRASLENVERLAKSLGVEVPRRTRRDNVYANQLVSAVATKIRREAMLDELRRLTSLTGTRSKRETRTRDTKQRYSV